MKKNWHILLLLIILTGCAVWPLGDDPKGKEYRSQANTLVELILKYKKENGELPSSLEALVPKYIQTLPNVANLSFYSKEQESLVYNYSASWPQQGQTSCSIIIGSSKWACHGYI